MFKKDEMSALALKMLTHSPELVIATEIDNSRLDHQNVEKDRIRLSKFLPGNPDECLFDKPKI